jgi:hypothetical protein
MLGGGGNRLLSLFVPFGSLWNKQGFQGFARRVEIKRERRLYWIFFEVGGGRWAPEIAAREGPQGLAGGLEPSERRRVFGE